MTDAVDIVCLELERDAAIFTGDFMRAIILTHRLSAAEENDRFARASVITRLIFKANDARRQE